MRRFLITLRKGELHVTFEIQSPSILAAQAFCEPWKKEGWVFANMLMGVEITRASAMRTLEKFYDIALPALATVTTPVYKAARFYLNLLTYGAFPGK